MDGCRCDEVRRDCERKVDDERYERERADEGLRRELQAEIRELRAELSAMREGA